MHETVTLGDIYAARRNIAGHIIPTPLRRSGNLSAECGGDIHIKWEQHQITGSFKLRGASNAVLSLTPEQKEKGVVGVSTGNHGRGLAYAAKQAGVRAVICMSDMVPQNKLDGIRQQGAETRIVGNSQDDAQAEVDRLVSEEGMTMIPPFDHRDVIAGQGTLGLEIIEAVPDVETVLVPLSGGGLLAGIARVVKSANPKARVIGISMERGCAMYESQKAGKPVLVEELPTLADALGGGVGLDNRYTFPMVRDLVDDLLLVSEEQIADAIAYAYWREQEVIEGSGAVGIAALRSGLVLAPGKTVVVASGRNLDVSLHHDVISRDRPE